MAIFTCNNKQDYEQRLLSEKEAFALDKRIWSIHPWNVTDGSDKSAISIPAPVIPPESSKNLTWLNLSDSKINGTEFKPTRDNIPPDKSFIKNGRKAKPKYHKKYMFQKDNETRSYKSLWTYRQYKVVSISDDYFRLASIEQVCNLVGVKKNKIHYYQIPMDEFGTMEFDIRTELGSDRIMINLVTCKELIGRTIVFNGVKNDIKIKDNTGKTWIYF